MVMQTLLVRVVEEEVKHLKILFGNMNNSKKFLPVSPHLIGISGKKQAG
jgi:hypothetical protein